MEWMTSTQVANEYGMSRRTLSNLRSRKVIPYYKLPGGGVRYNKDELLKWNLKFRFSTN
jgi:excisionase family DNA binding protein